MTTSNSIIAGQWSGYFEYGYEYGLGKEKVKFRLILEDLGNGKFKGKGIELEGFGFNPGIAFVEGFLEASFISFNIEYSNYYQTDENGNEFEVTYPVKPLITYTGNYNWLEKSFNGKWEILMDDENDKDGNLIAVGSGTWKMWKI